MITFEKLYLFSFLKKSYGGTALMFVRPKTELKLSPYLKACVHYIKRVYTTEIIILTLRYHILFYPSRNAYSGDYSLF